MSASLLSAAFGLGFLGSLHCLGMCGPLALALPTTATSKGMHLLGRLLYNLGRVVTYMGLGVVAGLIGKTLAWAGLQQALSIVVGLLILVSVLLTRPFAARFTRPLYGLVELLKRRLGLLLRRPGVGTLFAIGLLNGLLPCGLVYVAMGTAALAGHPLGGALTMAAFGIGTVPLMLAISLAGKPVQQGLRLRFQKLVPISLCVLSVLFVLRGLGLGIPLVSPRFSAEGSSCCPHHHEAGDPRPPAEAAH